MSRPEDIPDPFDEQLRQAFRTLARHRGACPLEDTLARLAAGLLLDEESQCARRHIAICGICELRFMNLQKEHRKETRRRPLGARLWALVRNPLFAYGLMLLVTVPAVIDLLARRPAAPAAQTVPAVNLNRERARSSLPVVITRQDFFALHFWIPEVPGRRYEACIHSESGKAPDLVLPLSASEGNGNFQILCRRSSFSSGSYRLTVREAAGAGDTGPWTFLFEVR